MATVSKSLNIQTEGVYTVELNVLPDGKTVTPVNDIQIWLHCAGIWDKTYTTLDEVLADTTTLLALISSNNAADYMARSTAWASDGLVPTMTSNTAPYGEASQSSVNASGQEAWKAFDGNDDISTQFISNTSGGVVGQWIKYEFVNSVVVKKAHIHPTNAGSNTSGTLKCELQGSNNDSDWTKLSEFDITGTAGNGDITAFDVDLSSNSTAYQYYRIIATEVVSGTRQYLSFTTIQFYAYDYDHSITEDSTAMSYIGLNDYCADTLLSDSTWATAICNSTYFESVLNVKVPTMTSNTTPSGEAFASSVIASPPGTCGGQPWNAFDNNTQKIWHASTTVSPPAYLGYKFNSACIVRKVTFAPLFYANNSRVKQYKIQGSNDNNSWTDLTEILTAPNTGTNVAVSSLDVNAYVGTLNSVILSKNIAQYRYYRLYIIDTYYQLPSVCNLQFYGR